MWYACAFALTGNELQYWICISTKKHAWQRWEVSTRTALFCRTPSPLPSAGVSSLWTEVRLGKLKRKKKDWLRFLPGDEGDQHLGYDPLMNQRNDSVHMFVWEGMGEGLRVVVVVGGGVRGWRWEIKLNQNGFGTETYRWIRHEHYFMFIYLTHLFHPFHTHTHTASGD